MPDPLSAAVDILCWISKSNFLKSGRISFAMTSGGDHKA